jgi:DNA-binding XRE family transcriptional regulator
MTPAEREAAGQRIARARRRRGLSQAVLAGLVGRSESWLSQVERGQRGVDSHSDAAGRILPGLIRGVETAARTTDPASPAACAVRARVYDITAALLSRVGEPFLAWAAADRAMFAPGSPASRCSPQRAPGGCPT